MNGRPIYESPEDREAESVVAARVGVVWRCQCIKLRPTYAADYCLMRGDSMKALIEIKCRRYDMATLDSMGGFMLSLHKWASIKALADSAGLPFVVIVRAAGVIWWHQTRDFAHDGNAYGGRTDRSDGQDVEPVILLKAARFRPLEVAVAA